MRGGLRAITAAAVLLIAGCASRAPVLSHAGVPVELTDTPFFPQAEYQCGPAALATVLQAVGAAVRPEMLVDQVYVPARQGSLQVELLAATRRAGRIPYVIEPELAALRAELDAGRAVLVLQNLGLRPLPVWHYAVVIGLDPQTDRVILRSGTERRRLTAARDFLRSWRLAEGWAMVALRPGEMPTAPDRASYLQAVALTERYLSPQARRDTYAAALARWPDDATARFGLAYALHTGNDLHAGETAYRALIADHPRHAVAYNNLAEILSARGCHAQARRAADRALEIAAVDSPALVAAIRETRDGIPPGPDTAECTPRMDAAGP